MNTSSYISQKEPISFKSAPREDFLWSQILSLPYFRALLRAVESQFYRDIVFNEPLLDIGCGDGDFVSHLFRQPQGIGIDPWWGPLKKANALGVYRLTTQTLGNSLPFKDNTFNSALSNSVLEHIPDVQPVLNEISRVLVPGANFVFCVPNHNFLNQLSISKFFDAIKIHGMADYYRLFFNRVCRHVHSDPPEVWTERLSQAGLRVEKYWHYFSPDALRILEWGHYFGLPSLICHAITRRWILVPKKWNLAMTYSLVEKYYREDAEQVEGVYTYYITTKK